MPLFEHLCMAITLVFLGPEWFSDPRTLLKTPNSYEVIEIEGGGSYYYFGIEKTIILLSVNIDGLPLSKSSGSSFWPILCLITSIKKLEDKVFIVALYHGSEKPKNPNVLLKFIYENNICINNILCTFRVQMLICDTPAKSYVLQVKDIQATFLVQNVIKKVIWYMGDVYVY
ncbi:hypothetical protein NQ315_014221 [Exocentrus adspersus]|uniref:Uncharacterized protein n=1 Tax=Exocentrus adspersus TaxID=1586481 RepID=A0AAV8V9V3_9CUCU|nr:hypothetical protein NQ315_014221 [Exocentrus adspersus]